MSYAAKFTNHVEIADDLDISGGGLRIEGTHSDDASYSLIANNHLKIQTDDNYHLSTGKKSETVNSQTEKSSYIDLFQNSPPYGARISGIHRNGVGGEFEISSINDTSIDPLLRITKTGNVGIGLRENIREKLHISDGNLLLENTGENKLILRAKGDNDSQKDSILFQNSGNSYTWSISRVNTSIDDSGKASLVFSGGLDSNTNNLNSVLHLYEGGSVGISKVPDKNNYAFDVSGNANIDGTLRLQNIGDVETYIADISNSLATLNQNKITDGSANVEVSNNEIAFNIESSNTGLAEQVMILDSNGNLGIHTTPGASNVLDVSGNVKIGHGANSLVEINSKLNSDLDLNNNSINNVESLQVNTLNAEELNINGSAMIDVAGLTVEDMIVQNDATIEGNIDIAGDISFNGVIYQNGEILKSGYWISMNELDTEISYNGVVNIDGSLNLGAISDVENYVIDVSNNKQDNLTFGINNGNTLNAAANMTNDEFVFATTTSGGGLISKSNDDVLNQLNLNTSDEVRFGHLGLGTSAVSSLRLKVNGNSNFLGDVIISGVLRGVNESDISFLDIDGTTKFTSDRRSVITLGTNNTGVSFVCKANGDSGVSGVLPEGFCFFSDRQSNEPSDDDPLLMYITGQSGNVGIKGNLALGHGGYHTTDNSDYKLYVKGTSNFTDIIHLDGTAITNGSSKVLGSAIQLASGSALQNSSGLELKNTLAGNGLTMSSQVLDLSFSSIANASTTKAVSASDISSALLDKIDTSKIGNASGKLIECGDTLVQDKLITVNGSNKLVNITQSNAKDFLDLNTSDDVQFNRLSLNKLLDPSYNLDVQGKAKISSTIEAQGFVSNGGITVDNNISSTNFLGIRTTNNNAISFKTNDIARMKIEGGGNILIGMNGQNDLNLQNSSIIKLNGTAITNGSSQVLGSAIQLASGSALQNSTGLELKNTLAGNGLTMSSQVLNLNFATISSASTTKAVSASDISSALLDKIDTSKIGNASGKLIECGDTLVQDKLITVNGSNKLVNITQSNAKDFLDLNTSDDVQFNRLGLNTTTSSSYRLNVDGDINLTGEIYQNDELFKSSYWISMNEDDTEISYNGNINIDGDASMVNLNVTGTITTDQLYVNGAADMELANLTVEDLIATDISATTISVSTNVTADTFIATSDMNYKENIKQLDSQKALDSILSINGYHFNFINDSEKTKKSGIIAQEVEKVIPEVVYENNDNKKGVEYNGLVPYLIECIKSQQLQIQSQKIQIQSQQLQIDDLKQRILNIENK